MTVKNFVLNINTVTMHGVDTMYWYSSGLYCRTQISVQSFCRIIGYQDTYGASRRRFRFAPFFYFQGGRIMERMEALTNYYTTHNEDARLTSKHGMVEFLTTIHYVEKYLKPGMRILEIGAGTGRYSHYFAQNGYDVDAVELMECNIEVFKANTKDGENITVQQGDAVDLHNILSEQYDITLLLGPMYHLYTDEDKIAAMSEAIRVTKKGGIVFAAYCNSDMTVYQFCFVRGGINNEQYSDLIDPDTFTLSSTPREIFALYRKEDIDKLMGMFDVERLHYVGTDMLTHFIGNAVDEMDEDTFSKYMKYHLYICERADMVGTTNHILDIFRKEQDDEYIN